MQSLSQVESIIYNQPHEINKNKGHIDLASWFLVILSKFDADFFVIKKFITFKNRPPCLRKVKTLTVEFLFSKEVNFFKKITGNISNSYANSKNASSVNCQFFTNLCTSWSIFFQLYFYSLKRNRNISLLFISNLT